MQYEAVSGSIGHYQAVSVSIWQYQVVSGSVRVGIKEGSELIASCSHPPDRQETHQQDHSI